MFWRTLERERERERGFIVDKIKKNEEDETMKERQVEEGEGRNKND